MVGFNLGAVYHVKAHRLENINHIVHNVIKRVYAARFNLFCGHGDINRFGFKLCLGGFLLHFRLFLGYKRFKFLLSLVYQLTHSGALLGGKRAHLFEHCRKLALFT